MSKKFIISNNGLIPSSEFLALNPEKLNETYFENDNGVFSRQETFKLTAPSSVKDISEWQDYIGTLFPLNSFSPNHNTSLIFPKDQDILASEEDVKTVAHYSCKPKVNYQEAHKYLNFISNRDERDLTCFYTSFKNYSNRNLMQYHSFKGEKTNKGIFVAFDENYNNSYNPRSAEQIGKMSNILFGYDFNFAINNDKKKEFPIYSEISFSTLNNIEEENTNGNDIEKARGQFGPLLDQIKMYETFVNDYIMSPKQNMNFEFATFPNATLGNVNYKIINLLDLMNRYSYDLDETNKIILSNDLEKDNRYSRNLKKLICLGKIRSISKSKNRNFMDLVENKPCQYEFLFYKVEKHLGASPGRAPISSFWCASKEDAINLVDTQVKANGTYTYLVKGYVLFYGTEYSSVGVNYKQTEEDLMCQINIETRPSYQVVEIDLFRKQVTFNMSPPLPPYVQFINESNASNRIKIFFDLQKGNINREFISINDQDDQRVQNMSPIVNEGNQYNFTYTAEVGTFEIFKTEEKPKNYGSFTEVPSRIIYNQNDSTSNIYYDRVLPNKKYYYIFRSVSNYNLVSNPTAIYEVELIKDADDSRVVVNLIQPEEEKREQGSIFIRRLLSISPATQHTILGDLGSDTYRGNLDNIEYGVAADAIWGKKFKLRLKSKDSGKKIDFNVLFNLVKDDSTEDFS